MLKKLFGYCGASLVGVLLFTGCSQKSMVYKNTKYTSAARHKATMKPYCVLGVTYHPTPVEVGDTMKGISSWYGPNFHGKYTSNGERYNMYEKTAAHKTWPMDTIVRVKNLDNGKSTIVRINDRGPFVKGRIIDCSYAAGKELGLDKSGIAHVKIEVVGVATQGKRKPATPKKVKVVQHTPTKKPHGYGVQVGAFREYALAERFKQRYQGQERGKRPVFIRKVEDGDGVLYRVYVSGFKSEEDARAYRTEKGLQGASVIHV